MKGHQCFDTLSRWQSWENATVCRSELAPTRERHANTRVERGLRRIRCSGPSDGRLGTRLADSRRLREGQALGGSIDGPRTDSKPMLGDALACRIRPYATLHRRP